MLTGLFPNKYVLPQFFTFTPYFDSSMHVNGKDNCYKFFIRNYLIYLLDYSHQKERPVAKKYVGKIKLIYFLISCIFDASSRAGNVRHGLKFPILVVGVLR